MVEATAATSLRPARGGVLMRIQAACQPTPASFNGLWLGPDRIGRQASTTRLMCQRASGIPGARIGARVAVMCAALSNAVFGRNVVTNAFDAGILNGWGSAPDWTYTASLEHRSRPRASLTVVYTHRAFRGFPVVDNVWLDPSDLTPFAVTAPVDGRLPGGGGSPVTGLYDVVPEKAG